MTDIHDVVGGLPIHRSRPAPAVVSQRDLEPRRHRPRGPISDPAEIDRRLPRLRSGVLAGHLYLLKDGLVVMPSENVWVDQDTDPETQVICTVVHGNGAYPAGTSGLTIGVTELEHAQEVVLVIPEPPSVAEVAGFHSGRSL